MPLISINNLSIKVKKDSSLITKINNQSFDINEGDVILLCGPNGSGKSSLIKGIVGDTFADSGIFYEGNIFYYINGRKIDVTLSEKNRNIFAQHICYVSQNDSLINNIVIDNFLTSLDGYNIDNKYEFIFKFVFENKLYKCFENIKESSNKKVLKFLKSLNINEPSFEELQVANFLLSKCNKMSGGQLKIINISSNLVKYQFCDAVFIDEPLNNLDYQNVRIFSNMLTRIHNEKKNLSILIVSHCRSIPSVNKLLEIDCDNKCIVSSDGSADKLSFQCNSCFGKIKDGYYI